YCHFGREPAFDAQLLGWMRRLRQLRGGGVVPKEFVALGHLLHDLRLCKSRAELKLMRAAAGIAAEAHLAAWRSALPGRHEYEVEAELLHALRSRGAVPAFTPIVAAGSNASDISRSIPINGRYSREQRALYEVVLAAQLAAIDEVRPGQPFDAAHH